MEADTPDIKVASRSQVRDLITIDSAQDRPEQHRSFSCESCQIYRDDIWRPTNPDEWHEWRLDWDEVCRASNNGCSICADLLSAVSSDLTQPIANVASMISQCKGLLLILPQISLDKAFEFYSLKSECNLPPSVQHRRFFSQVLKPINIAAPELLPWVRSGRKISSSGDLEECLELAKSWLHACVSTHISCAPICSSYLPTRIIDVGSSVIEPQLYIPRGRGEQGEYIALSHCWGTEKPPMQTTTENLTSMCQEIPFSELPRNFQDAVKVARAFGVRYLWIDSLCILQDSKDDWSSESAYMSDVYADALFVLVAVEGNSSENGFLQRRAVPQMAAIIMGESATTEVSSLSIRFSPNLFDSYGCHSRRGDKRSKLSTRGWAFQEQVLARRVLAYSGEEMSWECLEHRLCECQITAKMPNSISAKHFIENAAKVKTEDYFSVFHKGWAACVEEYSLRNLSFSSDRLAAFSGIATKVASPTTGKYLAGVWLHYLLHGLAWMADGLSQPPQCGGRLFSSKRQERGYAPSWSWASITGPISYWSVTATIEPIWDILIRRVHVLNGAGLYLSPLEASLKLTGRLANITIDQPSFSDEQVHSFKIFFHDGSTWELGGDRYWPARPVNPDIWDAEYYEFGGLYYLLSMFHYEDHNRPPEIDFPWGVVAIALILKKIGDEGNVYERVGCALLTKEVHALYLVNSQETEFTFV